MDALPRKHTGTDWINNCAQMKEAYEPTPKAHPGPSVVNRPTRKMPELINPLPKDLEERKL